MVLVVSLLLEPDGRYSAETPGTDTAAVPLSLPCRLAASEACGGMLSVGSLPIASAAGARSLCRVSKRLGAPIEITKPTIAAEVRTRRLTFG